MREGKYQPHEAVLRMKQDLSSGNPQMWDVAPYRVLKDKRPYYKTVGESTIYPTYGFTHCLCDSFEGTTHSLYTTEFDFSRVSYEWLCDKLNVYKPMQREYVHVCAKFTPLDRHALFRWNGSGLFLRDTMISSSFRQAE